MIDLAVQKSPYLPEIKMNWGQKNGPKYPVNISNNNRLIIGENGLSYRLLSNGPYHIKQTTQHFIRNDTTGRKFSIRREIALSSFEEEASDRPTDRPTDILSPHHFTLPV